MMTSLHAGQLQLMRFDMHLLRACYHFAESRLYAGLDFGCV